MTLVCLPFATVKLMPIAKSVFSLAVLLIFSVLSIILSAIFVIRDTLSIDHTIFKRASVNVTGFIVKRTLTTSTIRNPFTVVAIVVDVPHFPPANTFSIDPLPIVHPPIFVLHLAFAEYLIYPEFSNVNLTRLVYALTNTMPISLFVITFIDFTFILRDKLSFSFFMILDVSAFIYITVSHCQLARTMLLIPIKGTFVYCHGCISTLLIIF
mmetsp:Transcript_5003/g.7390  ORF Transcript_5003/g.7390 Transcript_5003/m.7390 type:complete len:211 (-) Transcript_5003:777-1409(-)